MPGGAQLPSWKGKGMAVTYGEEICNHLEETSRGKPDIVFDQTAFASMDVSMGGGLEGLHWSCLRKAV
eukprot:13361819-Ditylum_brightwellii.AAC.1